MQISLKWINELVDIETISLDDLIEKLTLGGFEVEEILEIEINNEIVTTLEISTTANRSDSLSIQGMALEIAALLDTNLKTAVYLKKTLDWNKEIAKLPQNNLKTKDCTEFKALIVENVTNFTSPKWLKEKLISSGIVPENNLIDFQNYIILERGYPIEIYDFDRIVANVKSSMFRLVLSSANVNDEFLANNQINYKLDDSILILKANKKPISLAGIIPNQNYDCLKTTTSLFIECSIFNAAKIRQQSRTLGLRTVRSTRYEKSLNTINLLETLLRFIGLLRISNPNLRCKLHTSSSIFEQQTKVIELYYNNIKEILGPIRSVHVNANQYILPETIKMALERLQFQVIYNEQTMSWLVTIPAFRYNDIEREIDLIEEIGRLYGFNNFLTRLPSLTKIGTEDFASQIRKKLTLSLISSGLNELIQYSLVPELTYLPNEINLVNPLVKDYANLRSSLLPNLVKAVEENNKKSNTVLEGFEYGHVFFNSDFQTIHEYECIAGIFGGSLIKSSWSNSSHLLTWFEAKSKLDELFKKLNLITYWQFYKPLKENTILHPYRSAQLFLLNQSKLGVFGQIHPLISKKLNISTSIYLFELNFELIKEQVQKNKLTIYQEYSSYPKIIKDLSFIIDQSISFKELKKILFLNGSKFLTEINLLDEYHGGSIPSHQTSLCIQFVFQSDTQTLTNKNIEKILDHFQDLLIAKFDVVMRT
jgi:phenylalanyl-tRNA synthetase beta chain